MCASGCVYRTQWTKAIWHDLFSITAPQCVLYSALSSCLVFEISIHTHEHLWEMGMPTRTLPLEYFYHVLIISFCKIYIICVCACMFFITIKVQEPHEDGELDGIPLELEIVKIV